MQGGRLVYNDEEMTEMQERLLRHFGIEIDLNGEGKAFLIGKDNLVNLNNVKQFPQVNMIFDKFCQGLWVNQRNAKKCYKYIVFGKRVKDKIFAVTVMRHIVCDILLASQIK